MNRNKRAIMIATIVCGVLSATALTIGAIIRHRRKIRYKLPEPLAQRVLASKHLQQIKEDDEDEQRQSYKRASHYCPPTSVG